MVRISVVMPAKLSKPMGVNLRELKDVYAQRGYETDAKIIESALRNGCTAFRYNYHKVKYNERKIIYYISISFDFMDKSSADIFFKEYQEIIE